MNHDAERDRRFELYYELLSQLHWGDPEAFSRGRLEARRSLGESLANAIEADLDEVEVLWLRERYDREIVADARSRFWLEAAQRFPSPVVAEARHGGLDRPLNNHSRTTETEPYDKNSSGHEALRSQLKPGIVIDGHVLEERLGEGSFGEVWKVLNLQLDVRFAMKILHPMTSIQDMDRFLREARTIVRAQEHDNVVKFYFFGVHERRPYYTMRLVKGGDLGEKYREFLHPGARGSGSFDRRARSARLAKLKDLIRELLGALRFLHQPADVEDSQAEPTLHLDFKPENILLSTAGRAFLSDFGLSAPVDSQTRSIRSGSRIAGGPHPMYGPVGTILYMAPELFDEERATARCDVWSFGVTLYILLTGEHPLSDELWPNSKGSLAAIFSRIRAKDLHDAIVKPHQKNKQVDRDLSAFCMHCLKSRDSRYPSAEEAFVDFKRWLDGFPLDAGTANTSFVRRAAKNARRNKLSWVTSGMSLAITALALVWGSRESANSAWLKVINEDLEMARNEADKKRIEAEEGRLKAERERVVATAETMRANKTVQRNSFSRLDEAMKQQSPGDVGRFLAETPLDYRTWAWRRRLTEAEAWPRPREAVAVVDWAVWDFLVDAAGRLFVVAGDDGTLRLIELDPETNLPREQLLADGGVEDKAWRRAISVVLDPPAGTPKQAAGEAYLRLAWLDEGKRFVGVTSRGRLLEWNLEKRNSKVLWTQEGNNSLLGATPSLDRKAIAVFDASRELIVVDLAGKVLGRLRTPSPIVGVVGLAGGAWGVATAAGDVQVVDQTASKTIAQKKLADAAYDLATDEAGKNLLLASTKIIHCDFKQGTIVQRRAFGAASPSQADPAAMKTLHLTTKANLLLAADETGRVTGFDWTSGETIFSTLNHFSTPPLPQTTKEPSALRRAVTRLTTAETPSRIISGGRDGRVLRWSRTARAMNARWQAGAEPHIAAVGGESALVWVGDASGDVEVRRVVDGGREAGQRQAHRGKVHALAARTVPLGAFAATIGADDMLRTWRFANGVVAPHKPAIALKRGARNVALSADGTTAAVYHVDESVSVWSLDRQEEVRSYPFVSKAGSRSLHGTMDFLEAPGRPRRLAVSGPGQAFVILNLDDPSAAPFQIGLIAGEGAAQILCTPDGLITASDTEGRIAFFEDVAPQLRFEPHSIPEHPLVGHAVSADGRSLALLTSDGRLQNLGWGGLQDELRVPFSSPRGVLFAGADRWLVAYGSDGTVVTWDAGFEEPKTVEDSIGGGWQHKTLAEGEAAASLIMRPNGVRATTTTSDDRVAVLAVRRTPSREVKEIAYEIALFEESPSGTNVVTIERISGKLKEAGAASRALSLHADGDVIHGLVRSPVAGDDGDLAQFQCRNGKLLSLVPMGEELENWKLDVFPTWNSTGLEQVVHMGHSNRFSLWQTTKANGKWRTRQLGRQGDGYNLRAAFSDEKFAHSFFSVSRVGGPFSGVVYLRTRLSDGGEEARETISMETNGAPFGAFRLPDGTIGCATNFGGSIGRSQTIMTLHRRDADKWRRYASVEDAMFLGQHRGVVYAARIDVARNLHLLTFDQHRWRTSTVETELPTPRNSDQAGIMVDLAFDSRHRPVVILGYHDSARGFLRVYRPSERP